MLCNYLTLGCGAREAESVARPARRSQALPIVGLGIEGGGGYQVRGVLDYGDWPVHRPATAIQGEGAAYWTRRVSVVRDAALSALAYVEPPSSVQESNC